MTISYNWLCEYLPTVSDGIHEPIEPAKLSSILTSIGLEVESLEKFEEYKGGFEGLLVGEVMTCEKHPDADKLKITQVSTGNGNLLQVVCGASNVAVGQKVILAPVGSTIYPVNGDPIQLKKAKIRGVESEGMICAEDEIGLGNSHDGIKILSPDTIPGTAVKDLFKPYSDFIFEIGLTPNRMDAMSHLGVAKDVCAWLSFHHKKQSNATLPYPTVFKTGQPGPTMEVIIENNEACKRYSGILLKDIVVGESPRWLQQRLKSIGLKPINNIVDITNFILHETGQPLHAFDADMIAGNKVIVRTLPEGTTFKTLDDKERKLTANDLMICNANEPMCIAGVYGGINSGVSAQTKNIFIESAWFNPVYIRKTSLKHDLRTDAASRFEKGTDISNTVNVLKRAALLIKELAGGEIIGDIVDVYPKPVPKTTVGLKNHYLKKLSGKNYHADDIKNILRSLDFDIVKEGIDELWVDVPYSKSDISLPADIVEEIMRIDGLDNIEIPATISISPAIEKLAEKEKQKEKLANYLCGLGFYEIFTNSITNSAFYDEALLSRSVKMINSLSADLDMLRPEMIQGGLQVIAHNINRKNEDLRLFEFGKTYSTTAANEYTEHNHLAIYITGNLQELHWRSKPAKADFYYLKGVVERSIQLSGLTGIQFENTAHSQLNPAVSIKYKNEVIGVFGQVSEKLLKQFDIKFPVFYADIDRDKLLNPQLTDVHYHEISKFPAVTRDLSIIVDKNVSYNQVEQIALAQQTDQLKSIRLFDIFESEKIGVGKKSMSLSFQFLDESKTMTDPEIDAFMKKIIRSCEEKLQAEIRK
jgi:phenylalanyl-tRNA synthetase beta chain